MTAKYHARVACYSAQNWLPTCVDVESDDFFAWIQELYVHCSEGPWPAQSVRAILENLIHAGPVPVVISVHADEGWLRVADQGPGIANKEAVLRRGFTSATWKARRFIEGVGAGLSMAKRLIEAEGGILEVEDNVGPGTVISLFCPPLKMHEKGQAVEGDDPKTEEYNQGLRDDETSQDRPNVPNLSLRRFQVLMVVAEEKGVGPSFVASHLNTSLSTAYRDLVSLEQERLIVTDEAGKRRLSRHGALLLPKLMEKHRFEKP